VRDLEVSYGDTLVLKRISLAVAAGEFVALLGPSGCGKTTLLRAVSGFVSVAAGSISVAGRDITHEPPDRRGMAMVFQSYALWPHMTTAQNLGYGLKLRKVAKPEIEKVKGIEGVSKNRRSLLPYGAVVLQEIMAAMQPSKIIVSALGVREGFLYSLLDHAEQKADPLVSASALSLALDARDNLLLGGSNGADAWVERHTPSGLLDTTFGEAGRATLDFGGSHEYVTALFAREDGSIVTSAISESTAGQHSVVTFLDESGSLITALGTDGTVELDPGNGNYYASDVVEQPDGTFLVSGRLSMSGVVGGALYFAKLDAQGGLVKSYGEGGFLEVGGSYNETLKMTRDPAGDGVAWATGGSLGLAATTFTLDAFAASGMSTGFALVHASSPSAVLPRAVAVDCARNVLTAGLVLAGGTTGGGVARFSMAGVPDASFGEAGSARWTPIDQNASFSRILPLPSGKVLAAGSATAGFTVAQYLN